MDIQTYPSTFALAILDAASAKGIDSAAIIEAAGVSDEVLRSPHGRIRGRVLQDITQRVSLALNDESLGFMKDPMRLGAFRMMCLASLGAPDLREAIQRMREFYGLLTDNLSSELVETQGKVYWRIKSSYGVYDPKNYMIPAFLGGTYRWMSWMINQKVILDHVAFMTPRPDIASDFNVLFGASVRYSEAHNHLCFDSAYLDKPVVQNEAALKKFLGGGNAGLLAHPQDNSSMNARVRQLLLSEANYYNIEIDVIAGKLNTSAETLRRKLKSEGTSFKSIKDGLRRDEAIFQLSRGTESIESVAEKVGFSDATAFFRAFKRWTGVTPRSYLKSGDSDE